MINTEYDKLIKDVKLVVKGFVKSGKPVALAIALTASSTGLSTADVSAIYRGNRSVIEKVPQSPVKASRDLSPFWDWV